MKLFLNNLIKGLTTALIVICLGGFISLKINISSPTAMVLVSTSLINSINTNENNIGDGKLDSNEENLVENDSKEVFEENAETDVKEETKVELKQELIDDDKTENIIIEETREENNDSSDAESKIEEIIVQGEYKPNLEVASTFEVIETYYGKMTGYGPDCYGCSGITASGMNVLNGNIYYNDNTFGNIRIVAGDKSIPFGSIIKITSTNISSEPVIAIVLDRGGMIGFQEGKHSYFDLLFESEQAATFVGRQDATFELLRRGY